MSDPARSRTATLAAVVGPERVAGAATALLLVASAFVLLGSAPGVAPDASPTPSVATVESPGPSAVASPSPDGTTPSVAPSATVAPSPTVRPSPIVSPSPTVSRWPSDISPAALASLNALEDLDARLFESQGELAKYLGARSLDLSGITGTLRRLNAQVSVGSVFIATIAEEPGLEDLASEIRTAYLGIAGIASDFLSGVVSDPDRNKTYGSRMVEALETLRPIDARVKEAMAAAS